jgi:hypothetical protein
VRLSLLGSALSPEFVRQGHKLIVGGPSGTGKTHLVVAIAYRAIQNGFDALFTTAAELIDHLSGAARAGKLHHVLPTYTHVDVERVAATPAPTLEPIETVQRDHVQSHAATRNADQQAGRVGAAVDDLQPKPWDARPDPAASQLLEAQPFLVEVRAGQRHDGGRNAARLADAIDQVASRGVGEGADVGEELARLSRRFSPGRVSLYSSWRPSGTRAWTRPARTAASIASSGRSNVIATPDGATLPR